MKLDPVMAEIRAFREAYSEKFGGDVKAMFDDLEKRAKEGGRELVSRPPKYIDDREETSSALARRRSETNGNKGRTEAGESANREN